MIKRFFITIVVLVTVGVVLWSVLRKIPAQTKAAQQTVQIVQTIAANPLKIADMRKKKYPGSSMVIEQTLIPRSNYNQYIASYLSDENKIYGLLTVPVSQKPSAGYPVIIFNHGYIDPSEYTTTGSYESYIDALASKGYIVFKPDYRGHGASQGTAIGEYGMAVYAIDVLNAVASIKTVKIPSINVGQLSSTDSGKLVDTNRIGMFGHSMGGEITLRSMVVSKNIKAGVIWAGIVDSYPDMYTQIQDISHIASSSAFNQWKDIVFAIYGKPEKNSVFWNEISPINYVKDISGPVQMQTAADDTQVPASFSASLHVALQKAGKADELYVYPHDDHNLSQNFGIAMERSIAFFDRYLK